MPRRINCANGFTLMEVLIVVAIVGILMGIGIPSYLSWMDDSKTYDLSASLMSSLSNTRSEAVKYGGDVVICPSSNGKRCVNNWRRGWITYVDLNDNATYDGTDTFISRYKIDDDNVKIDARNSKNQRVRSLVFNYRGYPSSSVTFSVQRNTKYRQLAVSRLGRVGRI